MDRKFKILAVIFVVVLVLITFAVSYQLLVLKGGVSVNPPMPTGSPDESENAQSLRLSVKLLKDTQESLEFNITQGSSITINVAFASLSKNHFIIPLYLSVGSFEGQRLSQLITSPPAPYPTVPLSIYDESSNTTKLFEASFTVNPLTLEPNENKTTDLTITALQEAQTGEYTMLLEMGNWEQTGLSAVTFKTRVLPFE